MTSAILSESYSFIWQPKVLMKTFFAMAPPRLPPRRLFCPRRARSLA